MSPGSWGGRALAGLLLLLSAEGALARQVSGKLFEDRDGDGLADPGEPAVPDLPMRLLGTATAGGAFDQSVMTDLLGGFAFAPGNGCYLMAPPESPEWRLAPSRRDDYPQSTPGYSWPVGRSRFGSAAMAPGNLEAGSYRITAMGDSIARNFNICSFPEAFWYNKQLQSRLACVAPGTTFSLDQAAVLGEHTDDLLVADTADLNNVFRVLAAQPDLITLSMIGNDLLDVDPGPSPTQTQINRAVAEILDARQNLQEALSALTSGVPNADIVLNTLYDNEAYNCATGSPGAFHRAWLPIVNRILRDLAWGQSRRASIAEAAADFAHENLTGTCLGFTGMICRDLFQLDNIHPTVNGYNILREKLWEGTGGVLLGPQDPLGRSAQPSADYGYLRRVRRLYPTQWSLAGGASATAPEAALSEQDAGTPAAITLGAGAHEFRLSGFPDWYDEIRIVKVLAGVRYRTTGAVADDYYRMEASVTGQFRPPAGHSYTTTDWNYYTPIVGGGGPNQPVENPDYPAARVLATPDVGVYREASATLSRNPTLAPGASDYEWPALTHANLATTAIRAAAAPVAGTAGNDNYAIELDAAWIDLYGWEVPRPPEVANLFAGGNGTGGVSLSFDEAFGAQRYNVYVGRLDTLASSGSFDHGAGAPAGPFCGAAAVDIGGGRRQIDLSGADVAAPDLYLLVTSHADDVESPAGFSTTGVEVDRSRSICR